LPAALGSALVATSSYAALLPSLPGLVIPIGALAMVTDASNTGQIQWDLTWIPLDDGAQLVAA